MADAFHISREAALALLNSGVTLTRRSGAFLGQCVADPTPLSDKQRDWMDALLSRASLPPLADGGDQ